MKDISFQSDINSIGDKMLLFLEKEVGGQGHLGEATPLVRYTNNYNLVAHIFPCHTSLHEIAYYISYHP